MSGHRLLAGTPRLLKGAAADAGAARLKYAAKEGTRDLIGACLLLQGAIVTGVGIRHATPGRSVERDPSAEVTTRFGVVSDSGAI